MARIERTEITQTLNVGLGSGPAPAPSGFAQAGSVLAKGIDDISQVASQTQELFELARLDRQKRENQRFVGEAKVMFNQQRADLLRGVKGGGIGSPDTPGILDRQGSATEGMTDETVERLEANRNQISNDFLKNPLQQQIFNLWAAQRTTDTGLSIAALESAGLERARQSTAVAGLEQKGFELANEEFGQLMDADRIENDVVQQDAQGNPVVVRQSTRHEIEDLIATSNPDLSDEAVAISAEHWLADTALSATYSVLNQHGVNGVGPAKALRDRWSDKWDATSTAAITEKINHEFGYGNMDSVAAQAMDLHGPEASALQLGDTSVKLYKRLYEAGTGEKAPDEHTEALRARVLRTHTRLAEQTRDQQIARRNSVVTNLISTLRNPASTRKITEDQFNQAIAAANGDNDRQLAEDLVKMEGNFKASKSIFPEDFSSEGLALYLEDSATMDSDEVQRAALVMPEDAWKSWSGGFTDKDKAKTFSSRANLIDAVNSTRAKLHGQGPWKKSQDDLQVRVVALVSLEEAFVETKNRKPSPTELLDMAITLELDFDDDGPDKGFRGQLFEFLNQPIESRRLSLEDEADRGIIGLALNAVRADPSLAVLASKALGVTLNDPSGLREADLLKDPNLAAKLIEFAIATDIEGSRTFGARTFVSNLVKGVVQENDE